VPASTLKLGNNHKTGKPGIPYRARFRCIADHSHGSWPLNEQGRYRCDVCDGLLEVVHDWTALKAAKTTAGWMKEWDDRYMKTEYPYGSGIWGKSEWVQPHVELDNVVSLCEGGTNMLWAKRFGDILKLNDLWIKQCGNSHTGSFKDLGMTVLVSSVNQMIAEGADIRAVACASTGDTSAALSAYAATAGIPCVVLLPSNKVTAAQLV
jgi:threonine synthase